MLFVVVVVCRESPDSRGIRCGSDAVLLLECAVAGSVEKWLTRSALGNKTILNSNLSIVNWCVIAPILENRPGFCFVSAS